jgi:predicted transcriptional regulator
MSGWVKIHRQILEWEWYDDINTCRLFFHLLIKANHKERNYKGKVVSVGETLTGLDKLSYETNLSVQQIRTSLNKLKSTNEITINSTSQGTVIKVVNYEKYQVATNEPTDEQQTNNKRVTTNKNDKNENNEKKIVVNVELFLEWFNEMKLKYKGDKGRFKTLQKEDVNNLTKLKTINYTNEEFEHAFQCMCNSKWVNDNNMITPAHFLRSDNFGKYVNMQLETTKRPAPWD